MPPDDIQRVDLLNRAIDTIYKELGGRASGLPGVQTVAPEADRAGGSRVPLPCPEAKISFVFWMPSINIGRHFVFGVDGFYRRMPQHLLYRQMATEPLIHRPANRHSNRPAELGCCNVVADGPAILD